MGEQWPTFRNPPITEALLDIRATLPAGSDLAGLAPFEQAARDRYPDKRERTTVKTGIEVRGGVVKIAEPRGGPDGFLFTSRDGNRIVQARLDGFTYNWLKPYESWESLRDEARRLWANYVGLMSPIVVHRLALRYINKIELPLPLGDFKEYILTVPEVAPGLPQGLSGLFMRLEIPSDIANTIVILTETMDPPVEGRLPFTLDIDVVHTGNYDPSSDEIWQEFEHLRDVKNLFFFSSLTARAKEMFQ